MPAQFLNDFIHISPGFKAAVNLKNDRNNLQKVAGFIPTEVAREIILDLAKKLHPASDLRSRIVMGTYGTGKSHLALVLMNLFLCDLGTPELQTVIEKLDPDTQKVLMQYRKQVPEKFLIVNLYGDEGDIADGLMMGLRRALEQEGLEDLLPSSSFDAALSRIEDIEKNYPDNFTLFKIQIEQNGMSVEELKTRLREYQKKAFDLFRKIHPLFSAGGHFEYTTMLSPIEFYTNVVKDLRKNHGFAGIVVLWDEFGHKMGEVVKDPTGKEGLVLQEFAECSNASEDNQIHFYLFCHRSLKEYHDITMNVSGANNQQLEDDLRKIEGRFKQFILKSTDVETFQLINAVIIANEQAEGWKELTSRYQPYFEKLVQKTAQLKYFTGFTPDELKSTVVLGTYPMHPMAVYSLPAISEKVAQNNRTLFTCLCEDEPYSFKRILDKSLFDSKIPYPPMFTVDQLWDYFSKDVKQQERTYSIYRDYELLKTRLNDDDILGLRILKAVSVFRVTNPTKIKVTGEILEYSLNIPLEDHISFTETLQRHSDLQNENHILMKLQADGTYRPAVSSATESLIGKVRKLLTETPEKLGQSPVQYLKTLWGKLPVGDSYEVTSYGTDFGVMRQLMIEPVSMNQLKESLHILTKNLGAGTYMDGILLVVLCTSSSEIEEAHHIASEILAAAQYQQVILAIPREPLEVFGLLKEHQALSYLKKNEASLYAEGGELHEEWQIWDDDKFAQITDTMGDLFSPEKQRLVYFWQGELHEILNTRQIKKLAANLMYRVFPDCPIIGEPKLAMDDFGGNWGYRKDCRDIVMKLTENGAAQRLWEETAAAPKHIITQIFKTNGILKKNLAGDYVIEKSDPDAFNGASKTWDCFKKYIDMAKQRPVEIKNLVRALRKPPFGMKCRSMPLFFAAVAHEELALGNISFEFQRNAKSLDKITAIESDTLEKVFTTPEKYKLIYVDVGENQKTLINVLGKLYEVVFNSGDPSLERVKKVGTAIGTWWRALPKHAQVTGQLSDEADILREHIFRPLAELEPDTQQILLKDAFEHVFTADKKVKAKDIEDLIGPIKIEFEMLINNLKTRIMNEYIHVFGDSYPVGEGVSTWFSKLPEGKKKYVYNGGPEIIIDSCRDNPQLNEDILLNAAEKLTGLKITSWGDDLVVKFGGKLESAKEMVDKFEPPPPPDSQSDPSSSPGLPPLSPGQGRLSIFINGKNNERILDLVDELSPNGHALENILSSTTDQLGKGLDEKEKIAIVYRFVAKHVFGA